MYKILITFLLLTTKLCYAQEKPISYIKHYSIEVNTTATDWTTTGIQINKGDCVLFQVLGTVNLGAFTKGVTGLGSINPLLLVHNRYNGFNHGVLLSANNEQLIPSTKGNRLNENLRQTKSDMPTSLADLFHEENFVGNYFTATSSQELKFVVNDNKIDDNNGFFTININILPLPDLDGNFDFAEYVHTFNGNVPFYFDKDCLSKYYESKNNSNGLWFDGRNKNGHYYLTINPVANYQNDISAAIKILLTNIYFVFPGRAVDQQYKEHPERSSIQKNHIYDLVNNIFNWEEINGYAISPLLNLTPEVKVIDVSQYDFTFEANKGHILVGTAVHGLFKDKSGKLYMFQQGRGVPDELWITGELSYPAAYIMWQVMASNFKRILD